MLDRIAVTVLNWNRADLLKEMLRSFLGFHGKAANRLYWIILDNGSFDESVSIINSFAICNERVLLDHNSGNGKGTSCLMDAFLKTGREFVLHIENDFQCLRGGFLENSVNFLEKWENVGAVRLGNKSYQEFNIVDKKTLEWSEPLRAGNDTFRFARCHYTFNPMLVKRKVIEKVFPAATEAEAQKSYYNHGWLTAQIQEPKCFVHAGEKPKSSFTYKGVHHAWRK